MNVRRYFFIILLLLLNCLLNVSCVEHDYSSADEQEISSTVVTGSLDKAPHVCQQKATGLTERNTAPFTAVLSEPSAPNRFANSRPQRILPVNASAGGRYHGKLPVFSKYYQQKMLIYHGKPRQERSPFRVVVAGDYYVIALRHIIR